MALRQCGGALKILGAVAAMAALAAASAPLMVAPMTPGVRQDGVQAQGPPPRALPRRPVPAPATVVPEAPQPLLGNPDLHVRLAAQYVAAAHDRFREDGTLVKGHGAFRQCDLPYIRFLSGWSETAETLPVTRGLLLAWSHQMTFAQYPASLHEVPGAQGALWWLDLRDWDWTADGWQAVAERDAYCAEPWIDHAAAEYLRQALGARLSAQALKGREVAVGAGRTEVKKILPSVAVMTASQFLRDTMETDRFDSYYDLLFGKFRFQGGQRELFTEVTEFVTERVTVDHKGGTFEYPDGRKVENVKAGRYYYDRQVPKTKVVRTEGKDAKFANFPADLADWEKAFGVDAVRKFGADNKLDLDFGAVVDGGLDDPQRGSFVGLHNRLVVVREALTGGHLETFDTTSPTGVFDYAESLIFAGQPFVKGSGAVAKREAGEILTYLPAGGQAGLLIDGAGKRVEFAGNNVAFDQASTTMDVRVRNAGSCAVCHAPEGGFIPPKNVLSPDELERGLPRKNFPDPDQYNRVRGFFREQPARTKGYQDRYLGLLAEVTGGWTGAKFAREIEAFRARYDGPLTRAQAAREVGVTEEALVGLLEQLPFNRARLLAAGRPVPRRIFEVDLFPNLQILREANVQANGIAVKH